MPENTPPPSAVASSKTGTLRLSGTVRSARIIQLAAEDCKSLLVEADIPTTDSIGKFDRKCSFKFPVDFATPLHDEMFEDGWVEINVRLVSNEVKILKESEMQRGELPPSIP
jgi:hypothetical protein